LLCWHVSVAEIRVFWFLKRYNDFLFDHSLYFNLTDKRHIDDDTARKAILEKVDLCVACGMCIPHCPTYQMTHSEAESPRGRLSLISAYLNGHLQLDAVLQEHLNHCLLCRSCEPVCPAVVPFAEIMDASRRYMNQSASAGSWLKRLLLYIVSHKKMARLMIASLNRLRLKKLLKRLPVKANSPMARYSGFAEQLQTAPIWKPFYPAVGIQKRTVGLFLGCVQEFFDIRSLQDSIRVLNYLGIGVYVPSTQQCCGAMHLHSGDIKKAEIMYQQNREAFAHLQIDTMLSLSSACTVTLMEREHACSSNQNDENQQNIKIMDIVTYLEKIEWYKEVTLQPVNRKILLHYPCTQRNVLKNTDTVYRLLSRIPGLSISEQKEMGCCGAAGTYTLDYPEWSDQLKASTAAHIDIQTDVIVSSNIGCMLQFQSISGEMGSIEVQHPINMLVKSLGCLQ